MKKIKSAALVEALRANATLRTLRLSPNFMIGAAMATELDELLARRGDNGAK